MTAEAQPNVFRKPRSSFWWRALRWLGVLLYGLAVWVLAFWIPPTLVLPLWHWWHDKDMRVLGNQPGSVHKVLFSPDGKTLYTLSRRGAGCPGMLKAWDVESGQAWHRQEANGTMTLSRDGTLLVAGSTQPGIVQFWDTNTWKLLGEADTKLEHFWTLSLSPDKRILVTGGLAPRKRGKQTVSVANLSVWSVPSGEYKGMFPGLGSRLAEFSPDGKWLALQSDEGSVEVYDHDTGKLTPLRDRPQGRQSRKKVIFGSRFSPDGKFLAVVNGEDVLVWKVGSWQLAAQFAHDSGLGCQLAISPDSRLLAVTGTYERWGRIQGGLITFWDTTTWQRHGQLQRHRGSIGGLAFSADGLQIATGSSEPNEVGLSHVP